ncbi:N-6 DNA methylase [Herpetosiphon sp. NSE202]|uniref:type I restriction-modification system subunit M n=1 Tax=Herpetosiphon sp. NSE202 TaxID=3351349 RepID=UPI0036413BCA
MNREQLKRLETQLWQAADALRSNSDLKASEYATPVLGLIFLKFVDNIYQRYQAQIEQTHRELQGSRREQKSIDQIAVAICGFYLPEHARYHYLLSLPEAEYLAKAIIAAMQAIEKYTQNLTGMLPQAEYARIAESNPQVLKQLLQIFANIPTESTGDLFGQIYEYFLAEFALAEGQGGGEFFTPRSVVRLMVEIIEPTEGKVLDPACGSGGMFVQSAHYIAEHLRAQGIEPNLASHNIVFHGQEKNLETVKLATMNLAVNRVRGDIRQAISYYQDPFTSVGQYDYVLANPPFNVDEVSYEKIKHDPRFTTYGIPRNKSKQTKADEGNEKVPNANYLWINLFATALNAKGRAGLVMANSASDARNSEADIRQRLIEENLIYAMVTLPSNMFYTVTLPATLWFFDKAKTSDQILFIDARNIFTQISRAQREFSEQQLQNIAMIVKLERGQRQALINLVATYLQQSTELLQQQQAALPALTMQLVQLLTNPSDQQPINFYTDQWYAVAGLADSLKAYSQRQLADIASQNQAQHGLRQEFEHFFERLQTAHQAVEQSLRSSEQQFNEAAKAAGKRSQDRQFKLLKQELDTIATTIQAAESLVKHVKWLHERFPEAEYCDVVGLCKLASPAEVAEQDYSLNAGRYVGVVIEDDGKTPAEFLASMRSIHQELAQLNSQARTLESVIEHNLQQLFG